MAPVLPLPPGAVLDGAMGTELLARGLAFGYCPELFGESKPEIVRELHRAAFAAGALAVQTNTFGANRLRLKLFGLERRVRPLCLAAALLAREVRPPGRWVIGDLGPAILPVEDPADFPLEDVFAEQAAALAEGGVDLLHLETLSRPAEALAAIRGVRRGAPGLPVIASMTLSRKDGLTFAGETAAAMLAAICAAGADAVGLNCELDPRAALRPVRWLVAEAGLPVVVRPVPGGDFAAGGRALFEAGAHAVGGCCGVTPGDIARLAQPGAACAIPPAQ